MRTLDAFGKGILAGGAALALFAPLDTAHANGFSVLHSFAAGSDGAYPRAGLIKDIAGNLYGTTESGGTGSCKTGCGTVFKLAPDDSETVLHVFPGGSDGDGPEAGLIMDKAGNLYGTTSGGGAYDYGTVFNLAPNGTETVLHVFTGGSDGVNPVAGLIRDAAGNLYGTTGAGGGSGCYGDGCGTVFKLAPDGTETVLYSFSGKKDGRNPEAGLIKDKAGNLYGTTVFGGTQLYGVVFKLAPDGPETVLHSFTGGSDGGEPKAGLIRDSAGNFYGTTAAGGTQGGGVAFKLAPDGTETVLHSFSGGSDGSTPFAGLIRDIAGNLYGTTFTGGLKNGGTVFKLAPNGTETVLYSFTRRSDGDDPFAGLIADKQGYLYGTAFGGGAHHHGTVFKLKE